jgi:hypothetical protein
MLTVGLARLRLLAPHHSALLRSSAKLSHRLRISLRPPILQRHMDGWDFRRLHMHLHTPDTGVRVLNIWHRLIQVHTMDHHRPTQIRSILDMVIQPICTVSTMAFLTGLLLAQIPRLLRLWSPPLLLRLLAIRMRRPLKINQQVLSKRQSSDSGVGEGHFSVIF